MQLYLNTYSLSPQNPPLGNNQLYNTIAHFRDLCQLLMNWDVEVLTEVNKKMFIVGGHSIVALMQYMTTPREKALATLVISVYNRYIKKTAQHLNFIMKFSLDKKITCYDAGVSYSYENFLPVVSFDYDAAFRTSSFTGFVQSVGTNGKVKRAVVKNLYNVNRKVENLLALQTYNECHNLSPKDYPMWNQTAIAQYFELIEHEKIVNDMIPMDDADRINTLRKFAPMVALLNGWEHNPTLSRLNSSSHKPREIFTSRYFASKNYYLSIDFEKPDFVFELIDTKGNHIKEINWLGTKTGGKKINHRIKLKK